MPNMNSIPFYQKLLRSDTFVKSLTDAWQPYVKVYMKLFPREANRSRDIYNVRLKYRWWAQRRAT